MSQHPPLNLIIITSDEMRGDCQGYTGNPDCKTPNLDALAKQSINFPSHFANFPKCVPSRVSIATGRYCHTDGLRSINEENHLPADRPNILGACKEAGYQSAVIGLNHVWSTLFASNEPSEGYADYHSWTRGLDHIWQETVAVQKPGPETRERVIVKAPANSYDGLRDQDIKDNNHDNGRVEQAMHYLKHIRDPERPFFLQLNISAPHPEYRVEEPWFSMYDPEKIEAFPQQLPENAPYPLVAQHECRSGSPEQMRDVQATYYGMISKVDDLVGRFLEQVRKLGLFENTVILFTSDHGDYAGQYGLPEKWDTCMADCLLKVPCLLYAPGLEGGRAVDSLSEHVDWAPTLCELLGLDHWEGMHGRSLLPVIRGEEKREAVFADGGHEAELRQRFSFHPKDWDGRIETLDNKQRTYKLHPDSMARTKMVRTEDWKLVIREKGGNELYNVREDPWELNNLYGCSSVPADVLCQLQLKLIEWCLRSDPDSPRLDRVGA